MALKRFIFCFICTLIIKRGLSYMRVCYYTNWSQFAPSNRLYPARIPPQLCTHIIFAYADVRATNITPTEFNDVEMYSRLNNLKQDSPSLQIILAVGGWAAGGNKFSRLVSSEASMRQFTTNLISYARRHNLDGINIDWEYPTASDRGSDILDRERYTRLLQNIRNGFNEEAASTRRERLSLSVAVETDIRDAINYYQIEDIGKILDFACLMAYDMHGLWDSRLGAQHHSPLQPEIRTYVLGWIQAGFPADKLLLGISGFGRSFILATEPLGSGLGQQVTGGGTAGFFSRESGLLDYGEICLYIARDGWSRFWLEDRGVPVAIGNTSAGWTWVGYDDPQSVAEKAIFIRQQGLAGSMFWSLEHDDFSSLCNNETWPLLRVLSRELPTNSSLAPRIPTSPSSPTTITTNISTAPSFSSSTNVTIVGEETTTATTTGPALHTGKFSSTLGTSTTTLTLRQVLEHPAGRNEYPRQTSLKADANATKHGKDDGNLNIDHKTPRHERQCKIAELFGPSLSCPTSRGKPGDRSSFYLYCIPGFFALECRCLPGNFFNRCLQTCDLDENFKKCPIVH